MTSNLFTRATELQLPTISSVQNVHQAIVSLRGAVISSKILLLQFKHLECRVESPFLTSLKALVGPADVKIEIEKIQSQAKRSPSKVGFLLNTSTEGSPTTFAQRRR